MNRLKQKYLEEIRPKLKTDFKVTNEMAVPQVTKVVLNIGIGEAKDNDTVLEKAKVNLASIAGQSPVVTKAKKSISAFKLTKGQPIGLMVTLRGERMYAFLDKFFSAVLPKVRDFRGISDTSFDSRGNFNLGLREQTIFPEKCNYSAQKKRLSRERKKSGYRAQRCHGKNRVSAFQRIQIA